jgi:hypothetical protein
MAAIGDESIDLDAMMDQMNALMWKATHQPTAKCTQCGTHLEDATVYLCNKCNITCEPDVSDVAVVLTSARLRVVGTNSNQLQPDLYRSGNGNTSDIQRKQIYDEYCMYRAKYIESHDYAFPLDACSRAADNYNMVQKHYVKRAQNKKAIMAACLYHACISIGFYPGKPELAAFMQLPSKGIARGLNFMRACASDNKVEIDIDADECTPAITTLFAQLEYDGPQYDGLKIAVHNIVNFAIEKNICINSTLSSKVAGVTFAVIRRCTDKSLVHTPITIKEFCGTRIRKNTVDRVTRVLASYHSHFAPLYLEAGLQADP